MQRSAWSFTGLAAAAALAWLFTAAAGARAPASETRAAPARAGPHVENFALIDHEGSFRELYYHSDARAIVLFVQGNGCPIARKSLPALRELRERFADRGVLFWLLNANAQDSRAAIAAEA